MQQTPKMLFSTITNNHAKNLKGGKEPPWKL